MSMSATAIEYIAANPMATAKEAGITNAEANALVGQGRLLPAGNRVTGQRGRPPMQYVVAGTVLDENEQAQKAVQRAKAIVNDHRHYERLSNAIMRAANAYGHGSEQHTDAKLMRVETFPVLPPLPSKNDYVLAGVIVEEAPLPDLLPGEEVE